MSASMSLNAWRGRLVAVLAVVSAAAVGACTEKLDAGANCSIAAPLCPGQTVDIRDTIIDPALVFDSTYDGFPTRGAEFYLPLTRYGDQFESAAVVRFDTLTTIFLPPNDTVQAITYVDSVALRLLVDLTRSVIPDSVRVDVYDVGDSTEVDSDTALAPVVARFAPNRRIGGRWIPKAQLVDSVFVPLSDSAMLARLKDSTFTWPRLRVGIRVSGPGPVAFRIGSSDGGDPVTLRYRPKADTAVRRIQVFPASAGPSAREDLRRDLADYLVVLRNTLPNPPNTILLGGVPGRRAYLRFDLPKRLTDSTTILRATLRLHQVPYPFGGPLDTVRVTAHVVLASPQVVDNRRAATLIGSAGLITGDSLNLFAPDSGRRELELYGLVRAWGAQTSTTSAPPRAIVLSTANEGTIIRFASFHSTTAGPGKRPTMRITYIPRTGFGVP